MGIEELGEKLQMHIDEVSASSLNPFSPLELAEILERYRAQDLKKYEKFKQEKNNALFNSSDLSRHKPDFHLLFHP